VVLAAVDDAAGSGGDPGCVCGLAPAIRERFTSIFRPQQVDSNQFRMITWRTGIRMIEAIPGWAWDRKA